MLLLPTFNTFVLVFSLVTTSNSNSDQIVENWDENACTLVVCGPAQNELPGRNGKDGPKGAKGDQGLRGLPGLPGRNGSPGPKGELEFLKTEISDLQKEMKTLKATVSKIENVQFSRNDSSASEKTFITNGFEGDFETAKTTCSEAGGLIASPMNSAENNALQQIIVANYKNAAYIGVNDIETEGTFTYLSGEEVGYMNWAPGEPNNAGEIENCVEMYADGRWNDRSCDEQQLIICEM